MWFHCKGRKTAGNLGLGPWSTTSWPQERQHGTRRVERSGGWTLPGSRGTTVFSVPWVPLEGKGQGRDERVPRSALPRTPAQCQEGA